MADALENVIQVLNEQLRFYRDLAAVLENKLDAMRHYDATRLEALSQAEQRLIEAIKHVEKKRNEAVRRATGHLLPQRQGELASARELAQAAPPPFREKLSVLASLLREVAEKVQRLNQIGALATQKIMGHFDHIFRIIAQSGRDIGLYGRAGKKTLLEQNRIVDAIA